MRLGHGPSCPEFIYIRTNQLAHLIWNLLQSTLQRSLSVYGLLSHIGERTSDYNAPTSVYIFITSLHIFWLKHGG